MQDLAEPARRDQADAGALGLEHRVRRHGRAVYDVAQVAGLDPRLGADPPTPASTPSRGSAGVDGVLTRHRRCASSSTRNRSVNVPPTSTPSRVSARQSTVWASWGRFTDLFLVDDEDAFTGSWRVKLTPSTPADQSEGVLHGIDEVCRIAAARAGRRRAPSCTARPSPPTPCSRATAPASACWSRRASATCCTSRARGRRGRCSAG